MNKGHLLSYGSIILLSFIILRTAWWFLPNIFGAWELKVNDQYMRLAYQWQGTGPISPDIVHIDLDDHSVFSLPYPKNDPRLYAELLRILSASGARTVLMDMLFPNCRGDACIQLADEVRNAGNVFFPVILSPLQGNNAPVKSAEISLPGKALWTLAVPEKRDLINAKILITNEESLNETAAGLGHINCPPDPDGVYRRIPLFIRNASGVVPSLALRSACNYLGIGPEDILVGRGPYVTLVNATRPGGSTSDIHIPVNSKTENRINPSGPWHDAYAHYSMATILELAATPNGLMDLTDELEDALVIVSDVSTGGRDYGPVPLSSYSPLSSLYGHFVNSILTDNFLIETGFTHNLLTDLVLIILLTATALYLKGYRLALLAGIFCCGFIAASLYLFLDHRVLMPVVRPSMSFALAVFFIMLLQFLEVQKEKQYIRATLTNYFAPSLMEKILNDPELIRGVSRKELTVLFSDIVGFTTWSSTRDAEDIHRTLNRYFAEMAEIVFAHEGTIDKYIGDGLMVFFGDPAPCPDHALRAVRAAQAMQKKTGELRKEWEKTGGMPIEIRIGINSGEMVVGNMGSHSRMDYTVIGSSVNLAQRLESNCPPGGILISEKVYRQVRGAVAVRAGGTIMVKGFAEPVPVYTVDRA